MDYMKEMIDLSILFYLVKSISRILDTIALQIAVCESCSCTWQFSRYSFPKYLKHQYLNR